MRHFTLLIETQSKRPSKKNNREERKESAKNTKENPFAILATPWRPLRLGFSSALLVLALLVGCGGTKELEKPKSSPPPASDVNTYESEFHPADYDKDVKVFFAEIRRDREQEPIPSDPTTVEPPLEVPGFRVQVFATGEIDEANARKAEAEAAFPEEWFYIAYDPPTYKLRTGNFINRQDAEAYARLLAEKGYSDAWVVPERIIKNIQPRPATLPPQEQQPQNK